ncbi:UMP kinase [Gammaproteobacteria bacterium]|nr:UMP kinase [Gammaproteobacteria bacterium]
MHFKRILIKISGQILKGKDSLIDSVTLFQIAQQIVTVSSSGVQVAIVIGGGNLFRGQALEEQGMSRLMSDQVGMLSTNINALFMQEAIESLGCACEVMSAMPVAEIEAINARKAKRLLAEREVVIFAGGTGNALVTTDTAASLRAVQIDADVMLKGTRVDGVYSADPEQDPAAKRYEEVSYAEVMEKSLAVMDTEAYRICRDFALPVYVFDILGKNGIQNILEGKNVGTLIKGD